ncbi:hypothetical protein, partial [Komarekiella delphini-convector]|uniref:hypothetical protein n=1 Tax=Komarekiella delphini-convector TaxID=3050158 RepID=UPI001CD8D1A8
MKHKSSKKSNFISNVVYFLFFTSSFSFAIHPRIVLGQPTQEPTPTDIIKPTNQNTPDIIKPTNQNTPDIIKPTNQNTPDIIKPTNQNTPDIIKPTNQ